MPKWRISRIFISNDIIIQKKVGHLVPLFLVPIGYIVENSSPVFLVKDF